MFQYANSWRQSISKTYNAVMSSMVRQKNQNFSQKQNRTEDDDLIQIQPRIYWMTYPSSDKIQRLSQTLQKKFNNNYFIWNLSEHTYEMANHIYPGYPCPILYEIFLICRCILDWLTKDQENQAIIQCQYTKGRSILVITLIMSLLEYIPADQCFLKVCQLLKIDDYTFFPTQHIYLKYVCNTMNNLKLNDTNIRIASIIINTIPKMNKIDNLQTKYFTPYIEILNSQKIIYHSLEEQINQSYSPEEQNCIFHLNGLEIHQDILIRCKHYQSDRLRYPAFRTMFHTSFIFQNVLRLYASDLDVSSTIELDENFFVDIIFERGDEKCQQNFQNPEFDDWSEIKLVEQEKEQQIDKECNIIINKVMEQCRLSAAAFNKEQDKQVADQIKENTFQIDNNKMTDLKQFSKTNDEQYQKELQDFKKKYFENSNHTNENEFDN